MAKIHNGLNTSWLGDAVKRALNASKSDGTVERFGETLTPVMNPWGMPEWAALRGEQLCAVRTFQGAIAAEFSAVALMNPFDSKAIIVVEAVTTSTSVVTQNVRIEIVADTVIAGTLGTLTNPTCARDRRFKGISTLSRATFRQGTDPTNTFGAQLEEVSVVAGAVPQFIVSMPLILKPGDDAVVIGQTVNSALSVNWGWRERQAFIGELA